MRIGVFGGTFDPPHVGHLILAEECLSQLKLDQILWVLTGDPPHKLDQTISPAEIRLKLLQAAIQQNPAFTISRIELERPGPHYSYQTLRLLHESRPQDDLFYLMGGDSLHDLPTWKSPVDLLRLCSGLGVMCRPGWNIDLESLERKIPGLSGKVIFVDAPVMEISSHQIRDRIAAGRPYRYYVPAAVYEVILQHGYYHRDC